MTPEEPQPTAAAEAPRSFVQRLLGALQLQSEVYDEIAADPAATNQAVAVVTLCALAQALGGPERLPLERLPLALAWAYFSWLVPGTVVWVCATRLLGMQADLPRVLRSVGFASAPQILWWIGLAARESVPFQLALGVLIFALALIANVVALRQAFAVNTLRALQAFALGFLAFAAVALVIGFLTAQLGAEL